jgi:hypothetical protein
VKRRVTASVIGIAALVASLGAAPAVAETDTLLAYLTVGKLKPGKRISYQVVCNANCSVTASSTLLLKGPNLGPVTSSGTFAAGQVIEVFLKPNKPARAAIKRNIKASKLRTRLNATNLTTGETDADARTFRFR